MRNSNPEKSDPATLIKTFDAVIEASVPGTEAACVSIPFNVEQTFGPADRYR